MSGGVPCPTCGRPLVDALTLEEWVVAASLTPTQRRIVMALARHHGNWVASDRLAAEVWADDVDGGPDDFRSNISVQVYRIRRKLLRTASLLRIEGVQGNGFRVFVIGSENHGRDGGLYRLTQEEAA